MLSTGDELKMAGIINRIIIDVQNAVEGDDSKATEMQVNICAILLATRAGCLNAQHPGEGQKVLRAFMGLLPKFCAMQGLPLSTREE